jgi:hypothetical protein
MLSDGEITNNNLGRRKESGEERERGGGPGVPFVDECYNQL